MCSSGSLCPFVLESFFFSRVKLYTVFPVCADITLKYHFSGTSVTPNYQLEIFPIRRLLKFCFAKTLMLIDLVLKSSQKIQLWNTKIGKATIICANLRFKSGQFFFLQLLLFLQMSHIKHHGNNCKDACNHANHTDHQGDVGQNLSSSFPSVVIQIL